MATVLLAALEETRAAEHFLSLAAALIGRGHRVTMLSSPTFRAAYEALGAEFVAVDEPGVAEADPTPPPLAKRAIQATDRVRSMFLQPMPAQWAAVRSVLDDHPVDVVMTEGLFLGAAILAYLPRSDRPMVVDIGSFPPVMPDPKVAPFGLGVPPSEDVPNRVRNTLYELSAAAPYIAVTRQYRSAVRTLTGAEPRGDLRSAPAAADVWAQLTVPMFEYPRTTLPASFRFVGPLRPFGDERIPDWWDPVEEPPVVAVQADPCGSLGDLVLPTIDAFGGSDSVVVVTGARRAEVERAYGRALPPNAHFEDRVAWSRLLHGRSVFVSSGDYQQVHHALRRGIPVVVGSTLELDVETAARVEWSGVGVNLGTKRPGVDDVRAAAEHARTDARILQAAARIAARIAQTDAEATLCDIVETAERQSRAAAGRVASRSVLAR